MKILKGNLNYRSEDQKSTMKNIKKPYSRLEKVLKFYYVSTRVVYDAEYKSFEEEGLKRLPIAVAQI